MAILDRISSILRSKRENLNEIEKEPEEPLEKVNQGLEKTDKIIQVLEKAIAEGRACIAEALSTQRDLETEKAKAVKASTDWKNRAERAVVTGREDIARDALSHKQESDKMLENFQTQWTAQHAVVIQLEHQLHTLTRKHADAVRNRGMLHARRQAIVTQQKMNQALQGISGDDVTDATIQIDQILQEVEAQTMAEAEVSTGGLENKFAVLEAENSIDDELSAIKKQYDAPQKRTELWFTETPISSRKDVSEDELPHSWLSDETKTIKDQQSFSSPSSKIYWFDDHPASLESLPTSKKRDDYWFSEEPSQPLKNARTDYWFSEEPKTSIVQAWQPNERTLQAGANVSLSKIVPDVAQITITIGRKLLSSAQQAQIESGIVLVSQEGKIRNQQDFICDRNRQSSCGSVMYQGERFIDDEHQPIFSVDLLNVPIEIVRLVIVIALIEASNRRPTFQNIASLWCYILNNNDQQEIASYAYNERGLESMLILGEIYRYKQEWKFKAIGQGFETGIKVLEEKYGLYVS